jgi:hypothetical protein
MEILPRFPSLPSLGESMDEMMTVGFCSASPDRENSQGFFMIFDTNYSGRKCRDGLKNVSTLVKHPPHNKICCRPTIAQCLKPSRTFAL